MASKMVLVKCASCGYVKRSAECEWTAGSVHCDRCECNEMVRVARHCPKVTRRRPPLEVVRCSVCGRVLLASERRLGEVCSAHSARIFA